MFVKIKYSRLKSTKVFGLLGALLLLGGCSFSPLRGESAPAEADTAAVESQDPEDLLLMSIGSIGTGVPVKLADGRTASAGPGYNAASGRFCRVVMLETVGGSTGRRLACRENSAWSWQPYLLP